MRELLRTNNPVLLSFIEALLRDAGLQPVIADGDLSGLEGSIVFQPRRVMVFREELGAARRVLREADLGQWINTDERE